MNEQRLPHQHRGFVQLIIILILVVIIISLLGISLRAVFSNSTLQENFGFVGKWLKWLWNNYLSQPFRFIYNAFIKPVGERFLNAIRNINFSAPFE